MFWFPAPTNPDPRALEFLAAEKEYLTGTWDLSKILWSSLVPVSLFLLGFAFWKRSLWYGLGIINTIAVGKMIWSVAYGDESGRAVLLPALVGLIICNATIYLGMRWISKRRHSPTSQPGDNMPA